MAQFAFIVLYLALAGALASWVAGAWFYLRTLRSLAHEGGPTQLTWRAVVVAIFAWPFALARLTGVRFRELPLTPERVWRALRARRTP